MGPATSMTKFTIKPWAKKAAPVKADGKKATRYYPAEDVKKKLGNHHNNTKQTKLRKSISPGTVLILLAGKFKGQRVVFLKQLDSGLLLISGPYKVNDVFFKKPKSAKKKDDELFFEKEKESTIDDARKAIQEGVDKDLVAAIAKTPLLKAYLGAKFSLKKGDKPHAMSF